MLKTRDDGAPFTLRYHGMCISPILERWSTPFRNEKDPRVNRADCRCDFFLNFGGFTWSGRLPVIESIQFLYALSRALPVCCNDWAFT